MTRIDLTRHRNSLGGTAGIALLGFALIYRFFPAIVHVTPQIPQQSVPSEFHPLSASQPPLSAVDGSKSAIAKSEETTNASAESTSEFVGPPAPIPKPIADLLQKADQALEAGHLFEPKDKNAFAWFQQVLLQEKDNAAAKAGLKKIQQLVIEQIVMALERGNEKDIDRLITRLKEVNPHAEEIESLQARLATLKQVTPLLEQAAELLKQDGSAISQNTEAILALYQQVLQLDPGNKVADQGLAKIERGYLDRALAAVAEDDFNGAQTILADASRIRPGSQELLDTRTRIENLRRSRAVNVLEQADSALDSGNPDMAEQLAKQAMTMSADLPGISAFNQKLKNARLYASYQPGQVITDTFLDRSGKSPALVVVPTGRFRMGSPTEETGHRTNEEPQREIVFTVGFALGRNEVTVGEFREFIKASGYATDAEKAGSSSIYDESSGRMNEQRGITWQNDYKGGRAEDKLPVIHVSWNDAKAYADWLSARTGKIYRLPSEAEFEYALRAGSTTSYWWGEGNPSKVVANITGDKDRSPFHRSWSKAFPNYNDGYWGPAPVSNYAANPFGLYDLDGNVSEWVEDCWHDNYMRAPFNSRAWNNPGCTNHVVRGGSWGSAPDQVRSAFRLGAPSDTRNSRVGFRMARDL